MLLEFVNRSGGSCWVNPEDVMFVPGGSSPVIILRGDRLIGLEVDGAEVARRVNAALKVPAEKSPSCIAPVDPQTVTGGRYDGPRPEWRPWSGDGPVPWLNEVVCRHCGRKYAERGGPRYAIICGAFPTCPHCGKVQGGPWEGRDFLCGSVPSGLLEAATQRSRSGQLAEAHSLCGSVQPAWLLDDRKRFLS